MSSTALVRVNLLLKHVVACDSLEFLVTTVIILLDLSRKARLLWLVLFTLGGGLRVEISTIVSLLLLWLEDK